MFVSENNISEAISVMDDCLTGCENGIKYRPDHLKGFFTKNDVDSFRVRVDEALDIYWQINKVSSEPIDNLFDRDYSHVHGWVHPLKRIADILSALAETPQRELT